jgi:cysteine synthase B
VVGIFADDGRKFKSLYTEQGILTESEFDLALANSKYISQVQSI